MPKGYWIGRVDVTKPVGYQNYVEAATPVFRKYGARRVVRSGQHEGPEGTSRSYNIVLEFADYATALACYRSPEYQAAKAHRAGAVEIDLLIIEGYDGPQL
jgi:uncharacterized protein (DUF1330 family)